MKKNNQYGFRSKRSCADATASTTEFMRSEIGNKEPGQAYFIDLQKAFDTLDHSILFEKLERNGYKGPIHAMIKSYVSDRWQHVFRNGICSDNEQILIADPQGSILGPFLFLLYVNDLHTSSGDCKVTMFTDDTT